MRTVPIQPPVASGGSGPRPSKEAVLEELQRILDSADFDSTARSRAFLHYLVTAVLSGHPEEISQHAIAETVFERGPEFDPATDPIVRMQAGRVRRSLEHYYLTQGVRDPVEIRLPKGTYVPIFQLREVPTGSPDSGAPGTSADSADRWPRLLLMPFRNLTEKSAVDYIARGVASDLAIELSLYTELKVILSEGEEDPRNRGVGADYEVRGSVASDGAGIKLSVQLLSADCSQLVWGHTYSCGESGPELSVFFHELACTLAATIGGERGMLAQHMAQGDGRRVRIEQRAYEAVLRYHHFEESPSSDTYRAALDSLENALKANADCSPCYGYLARLLAYSFANGLSQDVGVMERAVQLASQGVRLAPGNQRALATLSYVHLLNDQVDDARREANEAWALNPDSLLVMEGLGYLLTLSGDWERGPALSRKAIRLNPFHLPVVHAGLWLDALRREDYEESRLQAISFRTAQQFWDPLMQAVSFAYLDQLDQARIQVQRLLQLKPDFPKRARWLIARYVKFDDLVQRIQLGLRMAGIAGGG